MIVYTWEAHGASRRVPASRAAFPYVYLKRKHAFVCLSTRARPRPEALGDTFFKILRSPLCVAPRGQDKARSRARYDPQPCATRISEANRSLLGESRARVFAPIENV